MPYQSNEIFDIFGSKYQIKYTDKVIKCEDDMFIFGKTDSVHKIIYVSTKDGNGNDLPENEIKITLYHEILHAILDTGCFDEENDNETLIEYIARGIYQAQTQKIL